MHKTTSLYLDTVRFLAAFAVFFHHVFELQVITTDMRITYAREAVMVFFVLSGFVINFVAKTKEHELKAYTLSRLSRLYSVVLPALALTLILDSIGSSIAPILYDENAITNIFARLLISVFYLNHLWNLTVSPLSNGPFWSIAYEFWYYLIFASAFYFKGKKKYYYSLILIFIAGPKIILLFPCWLIGVATYNIYCKYAETWSAGKYIFPLTLLAMYWVVVYGYPTQPYVNMMRDSLIDGYFIMFSIKIFIGGQVNFLNDYLFCLLFALSIFTSNAFFRLFSEMPRFSHLIRYLAGNTFSVYLYHVPLLLFFQALFYSRQDYPRMFELLSVILILIVVFILAKYTEAKKSFYSKIIDKAVTPFFNFLPTSKLRN